VTEEQWGQLVRRLEPEARANPQAYARKVALLGTLGYVFLGAALLALTGLTALVIWAAVVGSAVLLKFLLPIGAVAFIILRSLVVKMDPPDGISLRREQAPDLFRMIDEVNERVRGPKLHDVQVNGDLNAGVLQIPRRGGIFGQRNYMVLGLPYMQALSPDEFRAVVAHELGHLSKDHGRFGTWVYRIQMTWWQLLHALESGRHWGTGIFRRFFRWYAPYFEAYSYPLRRAHEFEADDAAAEAAGPRAAATCLLVGAVAGRYLDAEYWPAVYRRADDDREVPMPFAPLREHLPRARSHASAERWLQQELTRDPAPHDTHPTTAERIRRLGLDVDDVVRAANGNGNGASAQTAAQVFLGPVEALLAEELDRAWRRSIDEAWRERHREAQQMKARLRELDDEAGRTELSLEQARERADLAAAFRSSDDAVPLYRDVLSREPNDAGANFALGQLLLDRGDEEGLPCLEKAMKVEPDCVFAACESAYIYLSERGRQDEAARYRTRAERRYEHLELAHEERVRPTFRGEFGPPTLSPEEIEALRAQLAKHKKLKRAFLVRRQMSHLDDEHPLHVLFVFPKSGLIRDLQSFVDEISADLDFDGWILSPTGMSVKRWTLRRIPGAKIYER
jgi:Zn-dependent protease with chaperone function